MANREWSKVGHRREIYYDLGTGEVLGFVSEDLGTGTFRAGLAATGLGEYVSQNFAKDAVRRAIEANEARAESALQSLRNARNAAEIPPKKFSAPFPTDD